MSHLSYAHGASDIPLIGETIGDYFDKIVALHPHNEAVVSVFEGRRLTYSQFFDEVQQCALGLLALGAKKGDRVGIWSTNSVAWMVAQYASAKIGAILVTLNPAYRLHELEYALKQSQCNYVVSGVEFKDVDYAATLQQLVPELATLKKGAVLESKAFPDLRSVWYLGLREIPGMIQWRDWLQNGKKALVTELKERQASLDFDDVICIQYTSGTTGAPKGAMLSHRGILNNGYWCGEYMHFTHRDRVCVPLPFYHCFGMVIGNLATMTHGATVVIPSPHFSPLATLEAVAGERCTALYGVPTMFIAELGHPRFKEFDLTSLRTGAMGGSPCPIETMKRVVNEMHCREITIVCGMTECSPVCNMTSADDPLELRVATVGRVMPHQEQKIIDPETGKIVSRGIQGELCYRGYHVMKGYYNNPEGTRGTMDADGWLHGGDLAEMDEQGYVKITGRLKDMIIRGGENIYPREIEEFLITHPAIQQAYVIGLPDPHYGEQVMAWVQLKEGEKLTDGQVRDFCKGKIMSYKVPKYVRFVAEFPVTVSGKIQKFKMREISIQELGLDPNDATQNAKAKPSRRS